MGALKMIRRVSADLGFDGGGHAAYGGQVFRRHPAHVNGMADMAGDLIDEGDQTEGIHQIIFKQIQIQLIAHFFLIQTQDVFHSSENSLLNGHK